MFAHFRCAPLRAPGHRRAVGAHRQRRSCAALPLAGRKLPRPFCWATHRQRRLRRAELGDQSALRRAVDRLTFPISGSVWITGPLPDTSGGALAAAATDLGAPGTTRAFPTAPAASTRWRNTWRAPDHADRLDAELQASRIYGGHPSPRADAPQRRSRLRVERALANYLLVATLAVSTSRASVDVENTSGRRSPSCSTTGRRRPARPRPTPAFSRSPGCVGAQGGSRSAARRPRPESRRRHGAGHGPTDVTRNRRDDDLFPTQRLKPRRHRRACPRVRAARRDAPRPREQPGLSLLSGWTRP